MLRLGDVINDSLGSGFLGLAKEMVRVFEVWQDAVGEYAASKAVPESVKGGILTVLVESSVYIDHFGYFRKEFIEKVNKALGAPIVEDIIFKVGLTPAKRANSSKSKSDRNQPAAPPPSPTPQAMAAVEKIEDSELKEMLTDFLSRQSS